MHCHHNIQKPAFSIGLIRSQLVVLFLLGSNASFSCTVTNANRISPDNSLPVKIFGHISCCLGKERILQWNRTQDLTVVQQLTSGVRYFEAQVAAYLSTGDFRVVCGLYGDELSSCMSKINSFLDVHEKEVIILDINKFYNMNDILHMKLLSIITHSFDDKLCPYETGGDVSLSSLWAQGHRVIVIYHHDIVNEYDNFWPGDAIFYHPRLTSISPPDLLCQLETNLKNATEKKLFKCVRGVVSFSNRMCLLRLPSSRKREISSIVTPEITSWLKDKSRAEIPIITVDFVNLSNFVRHVVQRNTLDSEELLQGPKTCMNGKHIE